MDTSALTAPAKQRPLDRVERICRWLARNREEIEHQETLQIVFNCAGGRVKAELKRSEDVTENAIN